MTPDLPTLLVVAALLSLAGALTFAVVLEDFSTELRAPVRAWAGALALMAVSWALLAARGHLPDAIAIVGGNVALVGSMLLQVRALRGFFGLTPWRPRHLVLLLAQVLISTVFLWAIDSVVARTVLGGAVLAVVLFEACAVLVSRSEPPMSRAYWLLLSYFSANLLALAWRTLSALGASADRPAEVFALPANLVTHALAAALPLVGSIGFLLLLHHRLARRLQAQAAEDALTGLSNVRGFEYAAAARWDHGEALALLAVDADHFKRINDAHGHAVGDSVLRWLGGLLAQTARQGDVVARLGGEEFALLLPGSTMEQAMAAAERLRERVAQHQFDEDGVRLRVTVSIGVAARRAADASIDAVLRRADQALYAAKAAGRNRVQQEA